ncbi:MAG: hypothetical protein RR933_04560, partial [Oscillospiraceae bacterium]
MFGRRPDGIAVKRGIDPITRVVPYIMTDRVDSQCYCTQFADAEILQAYCRKKRAEGMRLSQMSVVIAAYIRAVAHMPELNRFVIGKTVYARKELSVSFAMTKIVGKNDFLETTVKVQFDPRDTIYQVADKVETTIETNRVISNQNNTDKVVNILLAIPGLVGIATIILKGMDRFGLMPHAIIDASPFHTSMFITNVASIKLNTLHHHLYKFGSTTVFLGLGNKVSKIKLDRDGKLTQKKFYPIAVTTDERVAPGAVYGMAFQYLDKYLKHPELLEQPISPEE